MRRYRNLITLLHHSHKTSRGMSSGPAVFSTFSEDFTSLNSCIVNGISSPGSYTSALLVKRFLECVNQVLTRSSRLLPATCLSLALFRSVFAFTVFLGFPYFWSRALIQCSVSVYPASFLSLAYMFDTDCV